MEMDKQTLEKLVELIARTREEEIGCDMCFAEMDRFVEMLHAGDDPNSILPLVRQHLEICENCHEEFDALLDALNSAGAK